MTNILENFDINICQNKYEMGENIVANLQEMSCGVTKIHEGNKT